MTATIGDVSRRLKFVQPRQTYLPHDAGASRLAHSGSRVDAPALEFPDGAPVTD